MIMYGIVLLLLVVQVDTNTYTDITNDVKFDVEGVVAAYGDFNSDKGTDVFVVSNAWTKLELYTWDIKKLHFSVLSSLKVDVSPDVIVGVAVTDFDGDGSMDVLLSKKQKDEANLVTVEVYYGNGETLRQGIWNAKMKDQPTIVDVNGDLYPDLFGENESGERSYWLFHPATNSAPPGFHMESQSHGEVSSTLILPNSNAFVDVTHDFHPELIVKSKGENGEVMIERWEERQMKDEFNLTNTNTMILEFPNAKIIGMVSFADMDSDMKIDMVVPVCTSADCAQSALYIKYANNDKWTTLITNAHHDWKFNVEMMSGTNIPFTIRYGDMNMDGFVDATAILERKTGGRMFPAFLINKPCKSLKYSGCTEERTFFVDELLLNSNTPLDNPVSVSLLDVFENGGMDFMVTCRNKIDNKKFYTKVLRNDFFVDAAFLKVAVVSGLQSKAKYGAIQVGASVAMTTTNTDGYLMVGKAAQISQSAYFALQLPYTVFGLGQSPNFVETITVGIPNGKGNVDRKKTWNAIIPNAQVIVIPHPKDAPAEWVTKLLVTPSKLLLQTGGVLIGTCLLIAGIILILHIKDKKEDEREKRKEAHKFHFDAL